MVHMVQCAQFVFHGVAAPVLFAAYAQQVVVGDVAGKRDFRPGVVIIQVPVQDAGVFHDGAQGGLTKAVGKVRMQGFGEIALKNVAHHVADAVGHLAVRERKEQFRVDNAEYGAQFGGTVPQFSSGLFIGDDRIRAALAARGWNGQHGCDGQRVGLRLFFGKV